MLNKNRLVGCIQEHEKKVPVVYDVDVVVAGAGISGLFAAIASGRYGAKTVIIDRFGAPGGNIGPGMVIAGGVFNEDDHTLPGGLAGLPREFRERLELLRGSKENNYIDESNIVSYLALKMMEESGVEFILSAYASDPIIDNGIVQGIFVESKSGRVAVRAKVVIDATGDANIAERAGVPMISHVPAVPENSVLIRENYNKEGYEWWNEIGAGCAIAGVDYKKYEEYCKTSDRDHFAEEDKNDGSIPDWAEKYISALPKPFSEELRKAWRSGEFRLVKEIDTKVIVAGSPYFTNFGNGIAFGNFQATGQIDVNDMFCISKIEAAMREHVFEMVRFLRNHIPGFENAYLLAVSPFLGARGGPCIEAEHIVTVNEAFEGMKFEDVIFRNIHEGEQHGGERSGFDVPYRILLPRGLDGMLVTGRGAGYLRRGHDPTGLRARPSMMVLGTTTGIAASMAARKGLTPKNLNIKELQKELIKHGFFLGEAKRLTELGLLIKK